LAQYDGRVSRSVKVTVAGQKLAIRTTAKPKYVKELASYVTGKVDEIRKTGRIQSTQQLALLAAMNIADELVQLRESEAALKRQVHEKTQKILEYLESAEQL
jgi:cell division protein ZapA